MENNKYNTQDNPTTKDYLDKNCSLTYLQEHAKWFKLKDGTPCNQGMWNDEALLLNIAEYVEKQKIDSGLTISSPLEFFETKCQ